MGGLRTFADRWINSDGRADSGLPALAPERGILVVPWISLGTCPFGQHTGRDIRPEAAARFSSLVYLTHLTILPILTLLDEAMNLPVTCLCGERGSAETREAKMRYKLAMLGVAAAAVFSGGSFSVLAAPCPSVDTSLDTYLVSGFSCTVNDKTISAVTATGIPQVTPLVTPVTDVNNPGLMIIFPVGADSGGSSISFTITAPSSDPMTDASLAITGDSFVDNGMFGDTETLSNGHSLSASNTTMLSDSANFSSAATSLTVTDNGNGFEENGAVLLSVTNQFSETPVTGVPEPSSLVLLGVGLSAFALARRALRPKAR